MEDHYKILGISNKANNIQIKVAFRKLAIKYHPDKNKNIDSKKFIQVKNSYDILIDSQKRLNYDRQYNNFKTQEFTSKYQQKREHFSNTNSTTNKTYEKKSNFNNSANKTYQNKQGRNNYQTTFEIDKLKNLLYLIGIIFIISILFSVISSIVNYIEKGSDVNSNSTEKMEAENKVKSNSEKEMDKEKIKDYKTGELKF